MRNFFLLAYKIMRNADSSYARFACKECVMRNFFPTRLHSGAAQELKTKN